MLVPPRVRSNQTMNHVQSLTKSIEHSHTCQLAYFEILPTVPSPVFQKPNGSPAVDLSFTNKYRETISLAIGSAKAVRESQPKRPLPTW